MMVSNTAETRLQELEMTVDKELLDKTREEFESVGTDLEFNECTGRYRTTPAAPNLRFHLWLQVELAKNRSGKDKQSPAS